MLQNYTLHFSVMADGGHKIIMKRSFLAVTKQLHLNRDQGFEEEFKVQ